jgi:sugar lactone lactonase YvrE
MSASHPIAPNLRCVLPGADILGETPLWCERTQTLYWLDIDGGRLQRFHPATGRHDAFTFEGRYVGSLALTRTPGTVLLAIDAALYLFELAGGDLRLLNHVEPAELDTRLNDGRCDAQGRFWVGTMDNQLHRPNGALYRIDADGSVHRQFGEVIVTNTIALSPVQDTLYFSDTRRFTTWQFGIKPDGSLGERRVFVDHTATKSRPDGACIDSQGYMWNAIFGASRIARISPEGEIVQTIELPVTNPTCACLGGPDFRTLYITTARKFLNRTQLRNEPLAGSLLAIDVEVPGLPEHRFGK